VNGRLAMVEARHQNDLQGLANVFDSDKHPLCKPQAGVSSPERDLLENSKSPNYLVNQTDF
jgi:hypothetical protein